MRATLMPLKLFFAWVVGVETVIALLWAWSVSEGSWPKTLGLYGLTMLYSGAASFIGGLVGFLFGVPRSVAASNPADMSDPNASVARPVAAEKPSLPETGLPIAGPVVGSRLRVNTNLESLSDAATKGLLAIGLTQLFRLRDLGESIGQKLGPTFGPGMAGQVFAVSMLIYGLLGGFFFGYLLTRIYLTTVFADTDPGSRLDGAGNPASDRRNPSFPQRLFPQRSPTTRE